ncbi:hypothetical protein SmJEL517_g00444 [Synchytrium microbalum]|uniref:histone deacetylase n=1 Tax=Synchytrium microbalum TaxID=1806994 RepID=A0A507CE45_9FUNG|nr:uncharacterized protein SmJEL517_g00444 [Synchytrium microbalum]TPX37751.1 hypothetical protein SmJEL517_g00444 [Synchytrium microbalum]
MSSSSTEKSSKRRKLTASQDVNDTSSFLKAAGIQNDQLSKMDARQLALLSDQELEGLGLTFMERIRYFSTLEDLLRSVNEEVIQCLIFTHINCLLHRGNEASTESSGESPSRITSLLQHFATVFKDDKNIEFESNAPLAPIDTLWRVHPPSYITKILTKTPLDEKEFVHFSPGYAGTKASFLSAGSTEAVFRAAGAVVSAVESVFEGPPGHHCGYEGVADLGTGLDLSQGFCFVNNVMVGAAYAVKRYEAKVGIIDFDVHHGNGTEDILRRLYQQNSTDFPYLFISTHQYEVDASNDDNTFFPGTGSSVLPTDPLHPYIINIPLPPNTTSATYRSKITKLALARLKEFNPDLIIISAGFDSHTDDSAGDLLLKDDDYKWISVQSRKVQSRIVSVLEGGYDEGDISEGVIGGLLRGIKNRVMGDDWDQEAECKKGTHPPEVVTRECIVKSKSGEDALVDSPELDRTGGHHQSEQRRDITGDNWILISSSGPGAFQDHTSSLDTSFVLAGDTLMNIRGEISSGIRSSDTTNQHGRTYKQQLILSHIS